MTQKCHTQYNMAYKISEVAKMLGITPQTLRFYEKYGITTEKSSSNDQRIYSSNRIDLLMSMKKYRNCGFTVKQTTELLALTDMDKMKEKLCAQQDVLLYEAKRNTLIAERLKKVHDKLSHFGEKEEVLLPALYGKQFLFKDSQTKTSTLRALLGEWTQHMPLVQWVNLYYINDEHSITDSISWGFVAEKKHIKFLKLDKDTPLTTFDKTPALRQLIKYKENDITEQQAIDEKIKEGVQQGYSFSAPIFCMPFWNAQNNGQDMTIAELYMPLKK